MTVDWRSELEMWIGRSLSGATGSVARSWLASVDDAWSSERMLTGTCTTSGISSVQIALDHDHVVAIDLLFDDDTLSVDELEAVLGPASEVPRASWDSPEIVMFVDVWESRGITASAHHGPSGVSRLSLCS